MIYKNVNLAQLRKALNSEVRSITMTINGKTLEETTVGKGRSHQTKHWYAENNV